MLNDELIGAYLDGELDAEKRALVEHWLAQDKGAAARLERMRGADKQLRAALPRFAADGHDPIAKMILDEQSENVVGFARSVATRPWARQAAALAAACVIGVFAGRLGAPSPVMIGQGFDAEMRLGGGIERILDETPSGASAPLMGGTVQVALSLQTADGGLCRQFRVTKGGHAADAVACREGDQWRAIVQTAVREAEASDYRTAGAGSLSPIEAALEERGGAMVLQEAEERALIEARWRVQR